ALGAVRRVAPDLLRPIRGLVVLSEPRDQLLAGQVGDGGTDVGHRIAVLEFMTTTVRDDAGVVTMARARPLGGPAGRAPNPRPSWRASPRVSPRRAGPIRRQPRRAAFRRVSRGRRARLPGR